MFDMIPFRKNNSLARRGDEVQSLFDNFFKDDFFNGVSFGNQFKVDLKEDEKNYIVEAELLGVNKENINIYYDNNYLTISAKREDNLEDKNENYVRCERRYGEFSRSFYIDNTIKEKIDATFNGGVLRVTLPKSENINENVKRIDIH